MHNVKKFARHTSKILHHLLQYFKNVFDHFETLCIKGLIQQISYIDFTLTNMGIPKFSHQEKGYRQRTL